MQMLAVAMYVGHPEMVTVKVIDRARLGFQCGFWGTPTKTLTAEFAEDLLRDAENPFSHLNSLFPKQND